VVGTGSVPVSAHRHDAGFLRGAAFTPQRRPQAPIFADQAHPEGWGCVCVNVDVCACVSSQHGEVLPSSASAAAARSPWQTPWK